MTEPESVPFDRLEVRITYRGKVYTNHVLVLADLHLRVGTPHRHVLHDQAIQPVVHEVIDDHTEKWIHFTPGQDGQPGQLHWVEPPPNQR